MIQLYAFSEKNLIFHSLFTVIIFSYYYNFTEDHLLVIGGYGGRYLSEVEMISLGTQDKVCQPLKLDYPVYGHSSVVTSRGVITCGGWNGTRLKTCTLQTKEGETKPFPSMIRSRSHFGMVVMDQSLIVVGGMGALGKMEKIGLSDNEWVEEDLPFKVRYHCVVSINETMVIAIGGADERNVSKRYFEFVNDTINLKMRRKAIAKEFFILNFEEKYFVSFKTFRKLIPLGCTIQVKTNGQKDLP